MNLRELSEQVISKAKIIDIIGKVVDLKQEKGGHWGLCPFHNDNHASMSVIDRDDRKMFNCFSCGTKGNVITFYSKFYGVSYSAATIKLAIELGIPVDNNLLSENDKNESLYKAMNEASNFYQFYLNNSTESKEALEYLHNRGITDEIISEFRIGLAPSSLDDLHVTLNSIKVPELEQLELGLINIGKDNKPYDLFRKRIMFPIINQYNKIVGFSGRIYLPDQKNESKYINSKETKIFHKGNILYNFHNASKIARVDNNIYIFEGFMDVIAAYKAGIQNGVAAMGTAFTDEHAKKILNVTNNIILCFDGDDAGIKALRKTIALFSKYNIIPDAVILPNNMDPDEYLNKFGKDALHSALKINHKNALEVLYEYAESSLNLNDLLSIENFKVSVFNTIMSVGQQTIIDYYLKKVAKTLNIEYSVIKDDFNNYLNNNRVEEVYYPTNNQNYVEEPVIEDTFVVIKPKSIIKHKHHLALMGIIAEMFKDKNRFDQGYKELGDNLFYIDSELDIYTSILSDLGLYYNQDLDLNLPRYFLNKPEILYPDKYSDQYLKCVEIMNRIEYKNTSNEKAFYENIDCIKKLLHDLNHVDFKNDVLSNPVTNKANQFLKHKQTNTVIVKTKRG